MSTRAAISLQCRMPSLARTAFVLGAGLGTRLLPWTQSWPKPLLEIGGQPLVTYAFRHLQSVGVERFIVNTHHCAERWAQVFPKAEWNGIPITFRHEPVLLETGGGLRNIEDLLPGGTDSDEPLLVYNGDVITDTPLEPLLHHHAQSAAEVTLAVRDDGGPAHINFTPDAADGLLDDEHGPLAVVPGRVTDIRGALGAPPGTACLFTGLYVVQPRFLRRLEPGVKASVIPAFLQLIREAAGGGAGLGAVLLRQGTWCDVGTCATFAEKDAELRAAAGLPASDCESTPPWPTNPARAAAAPVSSAPRRSTSP
ncbi:hypothetical protein DB346_10535 [Verrucomicrobia bacterium LW23]|nr:hypothetical protein DB346_10535 [Verrucomicrobia bacterium LW23]